MPEGPTIRHTADLLRAALEGQPITRFHSPLKKAAAEGWAEKIVGQPVRAVRSLFAARIHPQRPAASLNDDEFERLIATSQDMMRRAYDTNSFVQVFLPPALRQATGKLGYVYGRSGQVCLRCGGTIAMVRQGPMQRLSFFCPFCQPLDPAHPHARGSRHSNALHRYRPHARRGT